MPSKEPKTVDQPATVIKYRMTKWQVTGQIIVAFLGVCGTVLGIWFGSQSENTVGRLDGKVIPSVQKEVDDLRADNKTLANAVKTLHAENDALRDRVSWLEGAIGRRSRPAWVFSGAGVATTAAPEEKKLDKILSRKSVEIPTIQMAK